MAFEKEIIDGEQCRLTKWKKEPSFKDLYADYDEASSDQDKQVEKILQYRVDMEGGKPLPKSIRDRGKSTQRPLVIRKAAEWAYPILEEPFLSTSNMFVVNPRGKDDEQKAKLSSIWLNWVMNTKIRKTDFIAEMVRTLYDEGTVLVKDGWLAEYDEIEVEYMEPVYASPEESYQIIQQKVQVGEMSQEEAQAMLEAGQPVQVGEVKRVRIENKLVENHPIVEVIDNTNITVDPLCDGDIDKARFIIHEYETDYATLKDQEYDAETGTGIYKNIDNVEIGEGDADEVYEYRDNVPTFAFKDKPRKKVKACEYWGYWDIHGDGTLTAIVATWIGKTLVRLEENPFPHGELPFSVATYMPRTKEFWGQPDAELLRENQETIGVYTRAMQDQTITNSLGQQIVDETLFTRESQWQAFNKGLNARSRAGASPDSMIYKSKIQPIDKSAFDMLTLQRQDAESLSGQKSFDNGISGSSLGSSVGGIKTADNAMTKRKLSVLRRISDSLLGRMARHMLANAQEFAEEEMILRLTDGEFVNVMKQDIQMEYDLKVEINTPEKEEAISNKIAFMLQTTMQSMPFDFTKVMLKRWARVNKMPDVEKDIDEIQPPGPTPEEQQMQQMQMEKMRLDLETAQMQNEKIKAEIMKLYSDKDRNDAHTYEAMHRMDLNSEKLQSEARLKAAQADKIESETDMLDAEFIDHQTGSKRQREVEDQEYKANVDLMKQQLNKKGMNDGRTTSK